MREVGDAGLETAQARDRHHHGEQHEPAHLNRQHAVDEHFIRGPVARVRELDAEDRARRTEDRGIRCEHRAECAGESRDQIERDEAITPQPLFHARAEEIQHHHVEDDVPESAMDEHVR